MLIVSFELMMIAMKLEKLSSGFCDVSLLNCCSRFRVHWSPGNGFSCKEASSLPLEDSDGSVCWCHVQFKECRSLSKMSSELLFVGHPVMGLAARKLLHFPLKILLAASVSVTFISRNVGHFP